MRYLAGGSIYLLSTLLGLTAFLYPFLIPMRPAGEPAVAAQGLDAPIVTALLLGLALVALLIELQGQTMGAKTVALLGVLVAMNSVLRFVEVAIPGPGGFTPTFAPIILAGYVFGVRFGFLFGAFTFLASGLITGGVGPWLPYQMTAAGWMGMSAGVLGHLLPAAPPRGAPRRREIWTLCLFGFAWGFLYGAIMNLYAWPFASGPPEQYWTPGIGTAATVGRYLVFYTATSLWWDLAGAVGNVALILTLGAPLVGAFERFRRRLDVRVEAVG